MISAINLYLNQIIYCFNLEGLAASGVESYQLWWLHSESYLKKKKATNFYVHKTYSQESLDDDVISLSPFPNAVYSPVFYLSSSIIGPIKCGTREMTPKIS